MGVDYGVPEVSKLSSGGDYGWSEVAILAFGGDYGGLGVFLVLPVTMVGLKWRF